MYERSAISPFFLTTNTKLERISNLNKSKKSATARQKSRINFKNRQSSLVNRQSKTSQ